MKRTVLLVLLLFVLVGITFGQQGKIYFEVSPGYSLGLGGGVLDTKIGASESTFTYFTREYQPLNATGFSANAKVGYGVFDNFVLLVGADYKMSSYSWTSASLLNADGSVQYSYSYTGNWSALSINPGFRVYTNAAQGSRFFAGAGAQLCIPFDMNIDATDNDPSNSTFKYSGVTKFDFSVGAYGEFGYEYKFNDMFGVNIAVIGNLLDLSKKTSEGKVYSGSTLVGTTTNNYSDSAKTDSNDRTESDVANTTADHKYYTHIKKSRSFSSIEAKIGLSLWF